VPDDATIALAPLEPIPAHVAVAQVLKRRIAFGAYEPGDRLPAERDLAQALGVGRMTVRAAVRTLSDEGLLATRRGRSGGTFVTERLGGSDSPEDAVRASVDEVRQTFAFRLALEPVVARWCAEAAPTSARREILAAAEETPSGVAAYRALDSRFHVAIAAACGNHLAQDAVQHAREEFFTWADAYFDLVWTPHLAMTTKSLGEHKAIARSIVTGDGEQAQRLMAEHIRSSAGDYESIVSQRGLSG